MSEPKEITARIVGYRQLTEAEQRTVNEIKRVESEVVASLWRAISDREGLDRRWLAIARTHFQEGFTALVRSITRPADPFEGGGK